MSLKAKAVSGVRWNVVALIAVAALQFGSVAVLARILTPADFGLMAIVMIVIGFGRSFADFGMSNAIIQNQQASDDELSSIYWFSVFLGLSFASATALCVPLLVNYYHEPRLAGILNLTCLVFAIAPLGRQFQVLMQKHMRFRVLSIIAIFGAIVNTTVAIGLALLGFGVVSLVLGQLAQTTAMAFLFVYGGSDQWRPRFHFRKSNLRRYLNFGMYQTGESMLNTLTTDIDKIIIGTFLGTSVLGFYSVANQLVRLPVAAVDQLSGRVLYSVLSFIQNETARFRRGYAMAFHYSLTLLAPTLVALALLADPFVAIVYGEKWLPVIGLIRILCALNLIKSLGASGGIVLLARGRADLSFYWKLGWTPVLALACIAGVQIGGSVEAVAWSVVAATISVGGVWHYLIIRVGQIDYRELFIESYGIAVATGGMAFMICLLSLLPIPQMSELILGVTVGVVVYAGLYRIADRSHFDRLLEMARK